MRTVTGIPGSFYKKMKSKAEEKKVEKILCSFCGKDIKYEMPIFIKTKRGSKIYLCRDCFKKGL